MSIKTILVPFSGDSDTPALKAALSVAKHLQAHIAGLHVEAKLESVRPVPAVSGMGQGAFGMATMGRELAMADQMTTSVRQRDQAAQAIKAGFLILCREWEVPVLEEPAPEDEPVLPSVSYRRETGDLPRIVSEHGQTCDLVVTESASVSRDAKPARAMIDSALLHCGRPVLLAPSKPPESLGGRVVVAWNDSPQCWRALSAALPFLAKANDVVLFHAGEDRAEWLAEEKAANYLAWHGVRAKVEQHDPGPAGVADYLMSQCGERQAGLMVMGAYSHSRWRERLLGGVTLKVLSNAAATPVLMVH